MPVGTFEVPTGIYGGIAVERYRKLNTTWWVVLIVFSIVAVTLVILNCFLIKPFGFMLIETAYLCSLIAFYGSMAFIVFPPSKTAPRDKIPWYDYLLFSLCLGISLYFATQALNVIERGWEFVAPPLPTLLAVIFWFLMIEAVRRASGLVLATVCLVFSFYPLFAGYMPGFMEGTQFSLLETGRYHAMSRVSILGIPMSVVGKLLVGYMIFGVVLQHTGGGKFFLDLSSALLGGSRGGPAKVAVLASALFGSMSGSAISNVVTTGSITIPTMKRIGYKPEYAGAIESCASTGGVLMPPIMGAAAFLMASLLCVPYLTIIVCAIVPSLLYYLGLLLQVDGYAGRVGLRGLPKSELPSLWLTLKQGWFYLFALVALIFFIVQLRVESEAPFYAIAILIGCSMIRKETRLTRKGFLDMLAATGRFMAEITAILAAIGLIIGAMSITGLGHSFSRELVAFAGGNLALLLIMGAATSAILGMGMTITACYVFLAIVLAPALIAIGLHPIAVHLFVMYWGMVSYITPPVALAAITASTISGGSALRTGLVAMRLGAVLYVIPFFFVLNPALILQAPIAQIAVAVPTALAGVALLASGLEGYLLGIGRLGVALRVLTVGGGLLLLTPERITDIAGIAILALLIIYGFWRGRTTKKIGY